MFNSGFKKITAGIALAVGLGIGSVQAAIDSDGVFGSVDGSGTGTGELFFSILDPTNANSLTLDLNVGVQDFLADPLAGVSVQSAALQSFIANGDASSMIWNIGGISNNGGLGFEGFFVVTTVDSDATPVPFPGPANGALVNAISAAGAFLQEVNGRIVGDVAQAAQGENGFFNSSNWANSFGGNLAFDNAADLGNAETATMVIIGSLGDGSATEIVDNAALANGFWSLDAGTGTVNFSAVPVPAAVWLFGSAIVGLIGFRRNS